MTESLKKKTSVAIFWSFLDKGGQQFIQLFFGCILARILLTSDFGIFAILSIFTAIANILQESGFSSALIRNKKTIDADYVSVFYFNIGISILLYFILFFTAPYIGQFYDNPILTPLARVVFLSFVFNSFGIIQNVSLAKQMDFKTNTRITLISNTTAGIVAISMALDGHGVWSLAVQVVLQSLLRSILLWYYVRWTPRSSFSMNNLKVMMPYSFKLLATAVMNQLCGNIYANIIGKYFSAHQTGVYSQANKFSIIPQTVVSDGIKSAAFPALSKIENDLDRTKRAFRKIVRITAFIAFPISVMIFVIAKPIIYILITDKWADSIPILQILVIGGAFYPLYSLTSTLLQTIGKSGLILKIESFRNLVSLLLIPITIQFGVLGLVSGISFSLILAFIVGMYMAGKQIKYTFRETLKDVAPYMVISYISILPLYFVPMLGVANLYFLLTISLFLGFIVYLTILKLAGSVILNESIDFLKRMYK